MVGDCTPCDSSGSFSHGEKRIFIVDDHPVVGRSFTSFLSTEPGLTVCGVATSFDDALHEVPDAHPDLVLVDISLGAGSSDGIELIRRLQATMDRTHWLVVSAKDDARTVQRAFDAGARGFLAKHEAADMLLEAVQTVLNGERYPSA